MIASAGGAFVAPRLRCGIELRVAEDACQVLTDGHVASVRYVSQFPKRLYTGHGLWDSAFSQ